MVTCRSVYVLVLLRPYSRTIAGAGTDMSTTFTWGDHVCCGDHKIVTHSKQEASRNTVYLITNSTEYDLS
jgi:hypothetical protein